MTQLLNVHPTHPQARLLKMAEALHRGELVATPATPHTPWHVMWATKPPWESLFRFASSQKITSSRWRVGISVS